MKRQAAKIKEEPQSAEAPRVAIYNSVHLKIMLPVLHRGQFLTGCGVFLAQALDICLVVLEISCVTLLNLLVALHILGADDTFAVVPIENNKLALTTNRAGRIQPSLQWNDCIASAILLEIALVVVGDKVFQSFRKLFSA